MLKHTGRKYDNVVVCRECRPVFDEAYSRRDAEYHAACADWRKAHNEASKYQTDWSRVNPKPKVPSYKTSESWIRRITCGCCGAVVEQEFEISKTPGALAWPWLVAKKFGVKVCPDCYAKPEHAALREALEEHDKKRDAQVGWRFREAEKLRPAWQYPELPAPLRLTEKIKRWFGL
jgi:hypothetical protein